MRAVSPARAAGLPLIITRALPAMMVPLFVGGLENEPPIGMWGGVLSAVLPKVAAGSPITLTFVLRFPLMIPMNG